MREVVVDTETTGLDAEDGDRIVEIACLELLNHLPTGRHLQRYVNPEREMPAAAATVHGLTTEFLADKPLFADVAGEFLAFIGDAPLVIHNADFDIGFINAELSRLGRPPLARERAIDTLSMARRRFPGAPASLDALCRRFAVDNSARSWHGALLDAELLAEVYLELLGGRQAGLDLLAVAAAGPAAGPATAAAMRAPRSHAPSAEELADHAALLAKLTRPVWLQ